MVRKIKFRGKDAQGNWFFGGITEDRKFIAERFIFKNVIPETVGQFTGFYDKSGNEIYEDDIVNLNCKIVGNIYDSPDLFENLQTAFFKKISWFSEIKNFWR